MVRYIYPNNKTDLDQTFTELEFIMKYRFLVFSAVIAFGLTACHPYYHDHGGGWDRHDHGHYGPPPRPYRDRRG